MTVRARVIPCLDVANGRVVKGVNFVDLIGLVIGGLGVAMLPGGSA